MKNPGKTPFNAMVSSVHLLGPRLPQALPHDHTAAQLARRPSEASAESETQRVMREKKEGKPRVFTGSFQGFLGVFRGFGGLLKLHLIMVDLQIHEGWILYVKVF